MSDDIEKLNQIAENIRRMNAKVHLIKLIEKAKFEYDKCDFESGRKSLIQAYLLDKKNPVILRGLGCIKQFNGKLDSALRIFNIALKYSEHKEIEYTLIGMVYYIQDKLDEAVYYFNLAIDSNEHYDTAYKNRNNAMLQQHLKIVDLQKNLERTF